MNALRGMKEVDDYQVVFSPNSAAAAGECLRIYGRRRLRGKLAPNQGQTVEAGTYAPVHRPFEPGICKRLSSRRLFAGIPQSDDFQMPLRLEQVLCERTCSRYRRVDNQHVHCGPCFAHQRLGIRYTSGWPGLKSCAVQDLAQPKHKT